MADLEGVLGGSLWNPPMRLNYLIFMENFQKNQETLINDLKKINKSNPAFINLNPLSAP